MLDVLVHIIILYYCMPSACYCIFVPFMALPIRQTDTLALLPLVKRQVFCVGDRLKMDKHKAWATTIVAPK